ncbi:UPF0262 family protein [Sinorhizobium chiapasense]|uniref:UPF0262 family protein n=1 Tax=Sinorhizobium chiapasense TaxID=501572 RepID=A0ABZ2BJ57_9HYPH
MTAEPLSQPNSRLIAVVLGAAWSTRANSELKRERDIAMHDLPEDNSFAPAGNDRGPFRLGIDIVDNRLVLGITMDTGAPIIRQLPSLPFKPLIKTYAQICENYFDSVGRCKPERLDAIDMARRLFPNDAAGLLKKRLETKVAIDQQTARRLFTLIYLLVRQGIVSGTGFTPTARSAVIPL